jgi:hypothetical protein
MMIQMAALFRQCQLLYGTFEHKKYNNRSHVWFGQFPETRTDNAIAFFCVYSIAKERGVYEQFPVLFCSWSLHVAVTSGRIIDYFQFARTDGVAVVMHSLAH